MIAFAIHLFKKFKIKYYFFVLQILSKNSPKQFQTFLINEGCDEDFEEVSIGYFNIKKSYLKKIEIT